MIWRMIIGMVIGALLALIAGQGTVDWLFVTPVVIFAGFGLIMFPATGIIGVMIIFTYAAVLITQYLLT